MRKAPLPYPPRIELARVPTPVQNCGTMGRTAGLELYVKRDDLTGAALSGNKVRKLEFVFADAVAQNADTVLTCGGAQSNHCRATAVAAAMLGLRCRLLLRTPDPSNPPSPQGNILLDRLSGAEIVWITPDQYRRRDEIFEHEAASLTLGGRRPYIIPEGASNALGAWGYIRAAEELAKDLADLPGGATVPATVLLATGSGGTSAGLILGAKMLGLNVRIASVNVCDDRDYFTGVIGDICEKAISAYSLDVDFSRDRDIEIIDGYVGRGYAMSRPEELSLLYEVARCEGIFLDPVYTVKAFFGMMRELERDPVRFGKRVLFLHTGGIFGLMAEADELAPLFRDR